MPDVLPRGRDSVARGAIGDSHITSFFAEAQSSVNGKYQASVRGRGRDALIS